MDLKNFLWLTGMNEGESKGKFFVAEEISEIPLEYVIFQLTRSVPASCNGVPPGVHSVRLYLRTRGIGVSLTFERKKSILKNQS
jgi:hypothetical protein